MTTTANLLFVADVTILIALLIGVVWSVAFPSRRIWPPPGKASWRYRLTWTCFFLVFLINAALLVLDWNTWLFRSNLRFIVGIPITLLGVWLVTWGITTLGTRNTSGIADRFVSTGPYRYTRNPQYLGDMFLFVGLSLSANSLYLWIAHILLLLVFLITPLAEESWLESQYGEPYLAYKRDTSRFL